MPGALDGQTQIKVGEDAVVSCRRRLQQLQHVVRDDRCLDARPLDVHQRPVKRRVRGA